MENKPEVLLPSDLKNLASENSTGSQNIIKEITSLVKEVRGALDDYNKIKAVVSPEKTPADVSTQIQSKSDKAFSHGIEKGKQSVKLAYNITGATAEVANFLSSFLNQLDQDMKVEDLRKEIEKDLPEEKIKFAVEGFLRKHVGVEYG